MKKIGGNRETDPGVIAFIKARAINSEESAPSILEEAKNEYPEVKDRIPQLRQTQKIIADIRKKKKERKVTNKKWKSEPFSLGALFANKVEVPADVVNALFSAQLQTQFCSASFSNNDAIWLIRLKGFYDSIRARKIRNPNHKSLYGFDGLSGYSNLTMKISGTIQPANDYSSTFTGEVASAEPVGSIGWDSRSVSELIGLAKTYSDYETIYEFENPDKDEELETRVLDSLLIWHAAPGIGQFLAASSVVDGRPFKLNSKSLRPADEDRYRVLDYPHWESTEPLNFSLGRSSSHWLWVDLPSSLIGWAEKNEDYLSDIAEMILKDGESVNLDILNDEQRTIYHLFYPSFLYRSVESSEKVVRELRYRNDPNLGAAIDSPDLTLVLAMDFLSYRAPNLFEDLPGTLERINKLMKSNADWQSNHLDPIVPKHPLWSKGNEDMSLNLENLCLEFEQEIKDWNPKSTNIRGNTLYPFILGLRDGWEYVGKRAEQFQTIRDEENDDQMRAWHEHDVKQKTLEEQFRKQESDSIAHDKDPELK